MRAHRRVIRLLAAVAVLAVAPMLVAAAHATPRAQLRRGANGRVEAVLTDHISSPGVYAVRLTVRESARKAGNVQILIGPLGRRATAGGRQGRALVTATLPVYGHTLTVRVIGQRRRPYLGLSLRRLRNLAPSSQPAAARTSSTAGATGATGASGATGSTGTSGATAAPQPAVQAPTPPTPPPPPSGPGTEGIELPGGFAPIASYTTLVKNYQFTGSSLPSDWSTGDQSYGFHATTFQPSQVSMTGSAVSLTANDAPAAGFPNQGGWISTAGAYTFTHGMIDFRAKMPAGQGLWSALWLLSPSGTYPSEEIDVQEMLLGNTHIVNGSLHDWNGGTQLWGETQYTVMAADATQGYHDYQLIWQPGMLTWAVDGVAYAQYTAAQAQAAGNPWPFDSSTGVDIIADLAVGGSTDWGGPPNAQTAFPASLDLQSVTVWQ